LPLFFRYAWCEAEYEDLAQSHWWALDIPWKKCNSI
jgi:hypothetical protein